MAWTETEPKTFVADMAGAESIYGKMASIFAPLGREHWRIHAVCHFTCSKDNIEEALRSAWTALRYEFPGLGVVTDGASKKIYHAADAQSVSQWVDKTFFVELQRSSSEVIAAIEKPRDLPCLYFLPATSEIVFLTSHWRADAKGTVILLNRLFSLLAQSSEQQQQSALITSEIEKLSPSLEDAAGSPTTSTPEMEAFSAEHIAQFHKNAVQTGGFEYKPGPTLLPGNPAHQTLALTSESTSRLVKACSARNITVTAALHAALTEAVFLQGSSDMREVESLTMVLPIDLRPYLQQRYRGADHACQTYTGSITPRVLRQSNFAERTAQLSEFYRNSIDPKLIEALRPIYKFHADALFGRRPPPPSSQPAPTNGTNGSSSSNGTPAAPPKPPSGVTINSLGILENSFTGDYNQGTVTVDRFRFGVAMMTRQTMLYAWTFRGQMTLSMEYNEVYYEAEDIRMKMLFLQQVLEKELAVQLDEEVVTN